MKQKKIHLDYNYRIIDNVVNGQKYIGLDENDCPEYAWVKTKYQVGQRVMLISHGDLSSNAIRSDQDAPVFSLVFDAEDGIGGITTDDISCYAHGLRKITKIQALKNGTVVVTVGPVLVPDED